MAGILNRVSNPEYLCYARSVERDLMGFPVVTSQFSGGRATRLGHIQHVFPVNGESLVHGHPSAVSRNEWPIHHWSDGTTIL
ncbi:hypothetical protein NL676_031148 [Syzygium grande]|nr:hypothetical protein NL676_031148 [Syzygium grande]